MIAAPVQALCQPIPKPSALRESSLELKRNDVWTRSSDRSGWSKNNFERVDALDLPGQFARRGGIIDIYAPLARSSRRDGDEAQSVRSAIAGPPHRVLRRHGREHSPDQSRHPAVHARDRGHPHRRRRVGAVIEQRELFTNILPEDAIIVFEEPADVEEVANVFLARIEKADRLYPWPEIYNSAARFTQLHICRFATGRSGGRRRRTRDR